MAELDALIQEAWFLASADPLYGHVFRKLAVALEELRAVVEELHAANGRA